MGRRFRCAKARPSIGCADLPPGVRLRNSKRIEGLLMSLIRGKENHMSYWTF